jgi:glucose/arabinose dehydrogenase
VPGWSLLRNVLVGVAVTLVVALGVGAAYAHHRGWLSREFWAASQPCGELTATAEVQPATGRPLRLDPVLEAAGPTALAFAEDGTGFVAEREGRILRLADGAPVLDLTGRIGLGDDQGLLGLAVANDRLFAWFPDTALVGHLASWPLVDGRPVADGEEDHLRIPLDTVHHNGGGLVVGDDGALYLGVGDGGLTGDPDGNAQDPDDLKGKVLRIDPAAPDEADVFALGFRNPFRLTVDPATGDLWASDVGHECMEEIDRVVAGGNHGWNRYEGTRSFLGGDEADFVPPVYAYPHDEGHCAVIGGAVVRGRYVFGDFCSDRLLSLTADGRVRDLGLQVGAGVQGVVAGPDGELYVLSISDGVQRVVRPGPPAGRR